MKILAIKDLAIPEIKIIQHARFKDERGYFSEQFRMSDFPDRQIFQIDESYSKKNVMRGLHFQWNPPMGKMVRPILGHMIDMILDIRIGSPTFGKIIMYEMIASIESDSSEWIWIPPGFAQGSFYLTETKIEYLCTAEYNSAGEGKISPLADDLDWSICDTKLKDYFDDVVNGGLILSEKDRDGFSLTQWKNHTESNNFSYQN